MKASILINQIAQRTVLSDDALSVLAPIPESIVAGIPFVSASSSKGTVLFVATGTGRERRSTPPRWTRMSDAIGLSPTGKSDEIVAHVGALREAVGREIEIAIECHTIYNTESAIRIDKAWSLVVGLLADQQTTITNTVSEPTGAVAAD